MSSDPYGPRPSTAQRIRNTIAADNKGQKKPPRTPTGDMHDPHYNLTKHCSPPPEMLIGYFYPEGFLGPRIEQWRIPMEGLELEYMMVVRRLKQSGKTTVECANELYAHFENAARDPHRPGQPTS